MPWAVAQVVYMSKRNRRIFCYSVQWKFHKARSVRVTQHEALSCSHCGKARNITYSEWVFQKHAVPMRHTVAFDLSGCTVFSSQCLINGKIFRWGKKRSYWTQKMCFWFSLLSSHCLINGKIFRWGKKKEVAEHKRCVFDFHYIPHIVSKTARFFVGEKKK